MSKTVIVTGASKGLGLAIAQWLIKESHNVVVLARSEGPLNTLQDDHPRQVRALAGDLTDFTIAQKSVDLAVKDFGKLDGVVVNHGAFFGVGKIAECDIEAWRKMLDVNFHSAVAFTKAALPELRKTKGSMVFTSSGAATGAYSAWGAYSFSKAAINALVRQIACEERDVTALAIRPGLVDTDMQRDVRDIHAAKMDDKDIAKFRSAYENKTLLKPEVPARVMWKVAIDPDPSLSGQYFSTELSKYRE